MKIFKVAILFVCSALLLAGCSNTVSGLGKDVQAGGRAIEGVVHHHH